MPTGNILGLTTVGVSFFLGQFHPPIKELKNSLIHHRPPLPRRREAAGSGSRYRNVTSNV